MTFIIMTYITLFLLAIILGAVSIIVAFVLAKTVSPARRVCTQYINGWSSARRRVNRIIVAPLVITFMVFLVFAIIGLTDTHRARARMIGSTKVIIRTGGIHHPLPDQEQLLLQLEDTEKINALIQRIAIGMNMPFSSCMCWGDMTFEFYHDKELHYSFSLHHGQSIRIKGNSLGDKKLTSASRNDLNKWLDKTGVTQALGEASNKDSR